MRFGVLVILIISISATLVGQSEAKDDVCQSKSCKDAASQMKSTSDLEANACDNFYQFACGRVASARSLNSRASEEAWNNRNALLRLAQVETNNPNMRALSTFHESCVSRRHQNHSTILNIIEKLGGFAAPTGSSYLNATQLTVAAQLNGFSSPFFSIETTFDELNGDTSTILIKVKPREFSNKKNIADFVSILKLSGSVNRSDIGALEKLRLKLVQLSDKSKKAPGKRLELIPVKQLAEFVSTLNLTSILYSLYYDGLDTKNDPKILVWDRDYLLGLDQILKNEEPRHIINLIMMQIIDEAATYSNNQLESAASKKLPRLCLDGVIEDLGFLFSFEYAQHYVSEDRRSQVIKMVEEIRAELNSQLDSTDWLQASTKAIAREKLRAIQALVAYPHQFTERASLLEDISGQLDFQPDSYLENVLRIRQSEFRFDASLLRDGQSFRDLGWIRFRDSTSVNAFYEDAFNSINILAGQLNDLLFDESRPMYLNYGLVGTVIGHELMHAFDQSGIKLDAAGNKQIWWDLDSQVAYERRLDCMKQLYNSVKIPGSIYFINGTRTLNENFADLWGLKIAYGAYVKHSEQDQSLPAFERFNGRQMFWLSYASNWCRNMSPKEMLDRYRTDSHCPEPVRVNIPLQNINEFSSDFNCPQGSGMNNNVDKSCDIF